MDEGNIKVVGRFRPQNEKELALNQPLCVSFLSEQTVAILSSSESDLKFSFDRIFSPDCTQQEVYETAAQPIVESVLQGFNGTVFAYGQTSSGKTFTMTGPDVEDPVTMGIIPRMIGTVFDIIHSSPDYIEYSVKVGYCEIYLEKIKDLLDTTKVNLKVHEDKTKGVYIQGLSEHYVSLDIEVYDLMKEGSSNREVAYTNMNSGSSRSHSLFLITVTQTNSKDCSGKVGKLYLVDLAGSEKVGKTGAAGMRLEEAKNINKSLTVLGQVINALTDGKSTHVPYRDSKLTRVLQDSLGGNSKTSLIVTCSPSPYNEAETISSLRFGIRAKAIKNKPKVNREYTVSELKILLSKAQEEIAKRDKIIERLEEKVSGFGGLGSSFSELSVSLNSSIGVDFQDFSGELEVYKNRLSEEVENSRVVTEEKERLTMENEQLMAENLKLRQDLERVTNEANQSESVRSEQEDLISKMLIAKENLENNFEKLLKEKFESTQQLSEKDSRIKQLEQDLILNVELPARPKTTVFSQDILSTSTVNEENSRLSKKITDLESQLSELVKPAAAPTPIQDNPIVIQLHRENEKLKREIEDLMKNLENRIRRVIELELQVDDCNDSLRHLQRNLGKSEKEVIKRNQALETFIGKMTVDFQSEMMVKEKLKTDVEFLQKKVNDEKAKNEILQKETERLNEDRQFNEIKIKELEDEINAFMSFGMRQGNSIRTSISSPYRPSMNFGNIKKLIKGGSRGGIFAMRQSTMLKKLSDI